MKIAIFMKMSFVIIDAEPQDSGVKVHSKKHVTASETLVPKASAFETVAPSEKVAQTVQAEAPPQLSDAPKKLTYSIVSPETLGNVLDEKLRLAALDQKFSEIEKRLSDATDKLQTVVETYQTRQKNLDELFAANSKNRTKIYHEDCQKVVTNAIHTFYANMNNARIAKAMTDEETKREAVNRLRTDDNTIAKAIECLKTDGNIRSIAVSQLSSLPENRSAAIAKLQNDRKIRALAVQELQSTEELKRQVVRELQERLEPIVRDQLTIKKKRQIDQELEEYRDFHMKKIREDNGIEEPEQPAAQDVELVLNLLK